MLQFQLERYLLDAVAVVANPTYDNKLSEQSVHIESTIGFAQNQTDPNRFMLVLSIAIGPDKEKPQQAPAYNVNVTGRAFYTFQEPHTREEVDKFLNLHGAAILYGLLRGQVAQITALGPHGQMLMPSLDFVEIQKQNAAKRAIAATAKAPPAT